MGVSLVLDNTGEIYVTGFFSGNILIDSVRLIAKGSEDVFLVKLSSLNGDLAWAQHIGGVLQDLPKKLLLGDSGLLYLLGQFNEEIKIDQKTLTKSGFNNFVATIDKNNGNVLHSFVIDEDNYLYAETFTLDKNENFVITGISEGIESKGSKSLYNNLFIAKYDKSGKKHWQKKGYGDGMKSINSIYVDLNGDILLAGGYFHSLMFDNAIIESGTSNKDGFLLGLQNDGNLKWLKKYEGQGNNEMLFIFNNGKQTFAIGRLSSDI